MPQLLFFSLNRGLWAENVGNQRTRPHLYNILYVLMFMYTTYTHTHKIYDNRSGRRSAAVVSFSSASIKYISRVIFFIDNFPTVRRGWDGIGDHFWKRFLFIRTHVWLRTLKLLLYFNWFVIIVSYYSCIFVFAI